MALSLCQPHYYDMLIIYLKFTAKSVEIKTANHCVIWLGLERKNYITNATNVKKIVKTNKWVN